MSKPILLSKVTSGKKQKKKWIKGNRM